MKKIISLLKSNKAFASLSDAFVAAAAANAAVVDVGAGALIMKVLFAAAAAAAAAADAVDPVLLRHIVSLSGRLCEPLY